jgi:hypothetical protein
MQISLTATQQPGCDADHFDGEKVIKNGAQSPLNLETGETGRGLGQQV